MRPVPTCIWLLFAIVVSFGTLQVNGECKDTTADPDVTFEVIQGQLTFELALAKCKKLGGHLARVTNAAEHKEVKNVLLKVNRNYRLSWIAFMSSSSSTFIDAHSRKPMGPFRRFLPSASKPAPPNSCVTVGEDNAHPSLWGVQLCSKTASALCAFHKIPDDYPIFIVNSAHGINYAEARALCQRNGAEIASFESEEEYNPLKPAVSKSTALLFVGYKLQNGAWFSDKGKKATQFSEDRFVETSMKYGCAVTVAGTHRWSAMDCNARHGKGAICRKLAGGSTGGQTGSQKVYYVINSGGSYYSLTPQCELDGGTVAKIESAADQQAVISYLTTQKINYISFFLRSVFVTSSGVQWSDRKPLTYKPFTNPPMGTWCPTMTHSHLRSASSWSFRPCSSRLTGVLCMKDPNSKGTGGIHLKIDISLEHTRTFILLKSNMMKRFADWEAACLSNRGRLAQVNDATSQKTLNSLMKSTNYNAMVGVKRSPFNRRQFVFSGGKSVTFTNWDYNQPRSYGAYVCLRSRYNHGKWLTCDASSSAICEVFGGSGGLTDNNNGGKGRPVIQTSHVKKRYRVITMIHEPTFEKLFAHCQISGGKPATLESLSENEKARLALSSNGVSRALIGLWRYNGQLKWATGSGSKFMNFGPGGNIASQKCVEMSETDGSWTSVACNSRRMLCEYSGFGSGSSQVEAGASYEVSYILVRTWSSSTFDKWQSLCKTKNAQLPLVLSAKENQALLDFYKKNRLTNFIFLGGQNVNNKLIWSDGTPISGFTNFPTSSRPLNNNCLVMTSNGKWAYSSLHALRTNTGICEIRKKISGSQTGSTSEQKPPTGKRFFHIQDRRTLHYNDWAAKCRELNAELAVIENAAEAETIKALMKSKNVPGLIAARKQGSNFFNPGNKPLRYVQYIPGAQPSRYDCIHMSTGWYSGKMQPTSCYGQGAICQPAESTTSQKNKKKFVLIKNLDKRLDYNVWQNECRKLGGHLAVIENMAEQDTANGIIKGLRYSVLMGPRRLASNKHVFVTHENKKITFSYWFRNEPNNLYEECTELMAGVDGRWNDRSCPHFYALCQVVNGGSTLTAVGQGKKIYKVIVNNQKTMNRDQWLQVCRENGGSLATIENAAEQTTLNEALKVTNHDCFIAIKRNPRNLHQFINPDGKPITYTNWKAGEPNYLIEECVVVFSYAGARGKWNDMYCSRGHHAAVCQMFETKAITPPTTAAKKKSFYVIENSRKLETDQLEAACRKKGWTLAMIENAEEQKSVDALVVYYPKSIMTGMKRKSHGVNAFVKPNGQPLTYTNWNSREPNNLGGYENCIEVYGGKVPYSGKWNDIACRGETALCQDMDSIGSISPPAPPAPKSFFLVSGRQGYDALKSLCQQRGGVLAMIENSADQRAVESVIRQTSSNVVIDGKRSPSNLNQFVYSNKKPLSYENWNSGEPNTLAEQCIMVYASGGAFGKWNDFYCHHLSTAACQKGGSAPAPPPRKSFFLVNGRQGYDALKALCQQKGAALAMIENSNDQKAAETIIRQTANNVVIDGKRSTSNRNQFVYSNGKPITFSAWNTGEPNNMGDEKCIMMYTSSNILGKWNDFYCGHLSWALCQKRG